MDEFRQLGYLREVEQMLALGRQSGLRLWLFAQTIGQIEDIYRDADRLMEMMAVRCFMEPSGRMAQELSKELGTARDIWNADKERPLATPQELSGPEYADKVIVQAGDGL
jgi:type IV secretion system protein VirD4